MMSISPDIIIKISMPKYPIGVFKGEPKQSSCDSQQRILRWKHTWDNFVPHLAWLIEPDVDLIKQMVQPYLI